MASAVTREQWQGRVGREWARQAGALEGLLGPAGAAGLERLAAQPGERILDIGCGSGTTVVALAKAVGPEGRVVGVDVSPDLVAVARAATGGMANARILEDDAERRTFPPEYDALFSRVGTVFFDNPAAAMANLRSALKPGGRAVFVAWREPARNQWASVPMTFVAQGVAGPGPRSGPGPFAWSDPQVFRPLLRGAGFRKISETTHEYDAEIGTGDDPDPLRRAVAFMTRIGPLAARLRDAPEAAMAEAEAFLEHRLARFVQDGRMSLRATAWIIEALA